MITDGPIITQVFENGNYGEHQKDSTLNNALRIYNRMPNRENNLTSNVGIVVGRVQSGKTANAITLSALAMDNGHKIVVLFLSDTNNLLTQNAERFMSHFDGIDGVEVIKKSKDGDFDTTLDIQTLQYLYEEDTKLVICSLKHAKHIQDICNLISKSPYKDDYALIIDDEGDDIGLNTAKFDEKFVEDDDGNLIEEERTATNKAIINLKESFSKLGYISLTATPEANILLQDFQQLAPDYCVTLEPNKGYTGLMTFHGDGSNNVVEIKDYCDLLEFKGLPESFEDAFIFFIAGCIIRWQRDNKKAKHSMMVHPCHKIDNHGIVYVKIDSYVSNISYNIEHSNKSGKIFIDKVYKVYNELCPNGTFDSDSVLRTIKNLKLHLVNSTSSCNDLKKAMKILPYHMVIGGNMLDRGITIEGLAVSYMIRMAKVGQADTLLQRARWFGYKESYIDLCRVYLPKELKKQFYNLIEMEESVWQFLYECDHNNLSPKDIRAVFQMPAGMRLAAPQKSAYITTNLISFTKAQSIIVHDKNKNKLNLNLVSNLDWSDSIKMKYNSTQVHRKKRIPLSDFTKFVNSFEFSEVDDSMNTEYLMKLTKRLKCSEIDLWDMRYDCGEKRSTVDYQVRGLLQGYSEGKVSTDPEYYVGDRNLKTDILSIQIHHVKLKNDIDNQYKSGDEVIMLAAILPDGYIGGSSARKLTSKEIKDKLK